MTFLLGRQATFGQEPPTIARSTTTVFWPWLARVQPRILPATPLPLTRLSTRSVALILSPEMPRTSEPPPVRSLPRGEPGLLCPAVLLGVKGSHRLRAPWQFPPPRLDRAGQRLPKI